MALPQWTRDLASPDVMADLFQRVTVPSRRPGRPEVFRNADEWDAYDNRHTNPDAMRLLATQSRQLSPTPNNGELDRASSLLLGARGSFGGITPPALPPMQPASVGDNVSLGASTPSPSPNPRGLPLMDSADAVMAQRKSQARQFVEGGGLPWEQDSQFGQEMAGEQAKLDENKRINDLLASQRRPLSLQQYNASTPYGQSHTNATMGGLGGDTNFQGQGISTGAPDAGAIQRQAAAQGGAIDRVVENADGRYFGGAGISQAGGTPHFVDRTERAPVDEERLAQAKMLLSQRMALRPSTGSGTALDAITRQNTPMMDARASELAARDAAVQARAAERGVQRGDRLTMAASPAGTRMLRLPGGDPTTALAMMTGDADALVRRELGQGELGMRSRGLDLESKGLDNRMALGQGELGLRGQKLAQQGGQFNQRLTADQEMARERQRAEANLLKEEYRLRLEAADKDRFRLETLAESEANRNDAAAQLDKATAKEIGGPGGPGGLSNEDRTRAAQIAAGIDPYERRAESIVAGRTPEDKATHDALAQFYHDQINSPWAYVGTELIGSPEDFGRDAAKKIRGLDPEVARAWYLKTIGAGRGDGGWFGSMFADPAPAKFGQ